jgi:hypothetical protein
MLDATVEGSTLELPAGAALRRRGRGKPAEAVEAAGSACLDLDPGGGARDPKAQKPACSGNSKGARLTAKLRHSIWQKAQQLPSRSSDVWRAPPGLEYFQRTRSVATGEQLGASGRTRLQLACAE